MSKRDDKLKPRVILLIAAVLVGAVATLPLDSDWNRSAGVVLVLLTLVSGVRPIRIPALRTEVSASDPFVFAAMVHAGGAYAAGASALAILGSALVRRPMPKPRLVLFNLGNTVLSTNLGYYAFVLSGGEVGASLPSLVLPMAAAATVYFLINTGLVTLAITSQRGGSYWQNWSRSCLWTGVSTYAGLTLAACLLLLIDAIGLGGLALGIPPCWLLIRFYRTHKERIEEQQREISRVSSYNAQLEEEVQLRTVELREALRRVEETNRDLLSANKELEQASRAKSIFLANMSHELRTPLNAIIGFSDLLKQGVCGSLNDEQRDFMSDIHAGGVHLLTMINDILDLSKIEAGKLEVHLGDVDVEEVLGTVASMVRLQAQEKELDLRIENETAGTRSRVDSGMMRQILANLLSNAVKFTPRGGRVLVRAGADRSDLRIDVSDTGIGIAPEDLKKVFEEFYQVDGTYSRSYQGTGLGLALVRRMVELHGGKITAESEVGKGTTFHLLFPNCVRPAEVRQEPVQQPAPAKADSLKQENTVLVVEDNPVNLKLARNLLRARGFKVLEAESGEEALRVLQRTVPDLILMDIQLPDLDGLEVTRRIKADPYSRSIPVVALSAHAMDEDRRRAMEAGCDAYLTKPIHLNRLASDLHTVLRAARARTVPREAPELPEPRRDGTEVPVPEPVESADLRAAAGS